MTVFISWSGARSKAVALIFKEHLEHVIQGLPTFMSDKDIASGAQWFSEINEHLKAATFGIICVTPDNVERPWLNFEAGAIGNQTEQSRVAPVAIGMSKDNLPSPLSGFNAVDLDEDGFLRLVRSIYTHRNESAPWEVIETAAHRQWKHIEDALATVPSDAVTPAPEFSVEDALKEIRGLLRDLAQTPTRRLSFESDSADRKAILRNLKNGHFANVAASNKPRFGQPSLGLVTTINGLLAEYEAGSQAAGEELLALGVDPKRQKPLRDFVQTYYRAQSSGTINSEIPDESERNEDRDDKDPL